MISQNAVDYTLRWWPDQKPEFLPLANGGPKVRYLRAGQGPALVLLHSIRTQLDLFQRVIPNSPVTLPCTHSTIRGLAGRKSCRVPTIENRRCESMSSISLNSSTCATSR